MKKKLTTVAFNGTKEQEAKLDAVIAEHKGEKGALMPVLQKAQDIYGYLPIEVQQHIALGMDVPLSEVYGVASFYSQFILNPIKQPSIDVLKQTLLVLLSSPKSTQMTGYHVIRSLKRHWFQKTAQFNLFTLLALSSAQSTLETLMTQST